MLSLIGVLAGLWADKFDQMAAVTNFIIQPLSFLSGAFYSTQRLPDLWRAIAHLNPFFYMIDGFRYGFSPGPAVTAPLAEEAAGADGGASHRRTSPARPSGVIASL